jgi:hypothetical protein
VPGLPLLGERLIVAFIFRLCSDILNGL